MPSEEATPVVSEAPTAEPTINPGTDPTVEPSATPEEKPTVEPLVTASARPTMDPTGVPTCEPSATPTEVPTVEPSSTPTLDPTVEPTIMPSSTPEGIPDAEPTAAPSEVPSVMPTTVPTEEPMVEPTEEPAEDFYVYTDTVLLEDLVCRNLFLMGGNLECDGYNISVQKDCFQNSGICSLQSTELVIAGDIRMVAGEMDISESELHIGGDFVIDSAKAISFQNSSIITEGDFSCAVSQTLEQRNGEMHIGGDLTIKGKYNAFESTKNRVDGDFCIVEN